MGGGSGRWCEGHGVESFYMKVYLPSRISKVMLRSSLSHQLYFTDTSDSHSHHPVSSYLYSCASPLFDLCELLSCTYDINVNLYYSVFISL